MIKSTELRIGNMLYLDGLIEGDSVITVRAITNRGIYPNDVNRLLEHKFTRPIPITEEWLLKFGWVWNEECKLYEKYPNGDARMNLTYKDVSCSYTMFNYVLKAIICDRIFYVHQLQNLYFSLTGEELTMI